MIDLPFTTEDFLEVFRNYNEAVWPAQWLLYLLGIAAFLLVTFRIKFADRIINTILAFLWLWMGIIYHFLFFSEVNPAAYIFGSVFIIQGILFLWLGTFSKKLVYRFNLKLSGIMGIIFLLYAFVAYPILSDNFGHFYPHKPTFGLPCHTTIFSFGILLFTARKFPLEILVIPFLWSLLGFSAAINLGVIEDEGLVVAGILGTALLLYKFWFKKRKTSVVHT